MKDMNDNVAIAIMIKVNELASELLSEVVA